MDEWTDLRFFLALARRGSTQRAARELGVNQSTVTRRIDALEEALGVRLFRRTRRGSRLTDAGARVLPEAERVEQAIASTARAAEQDVAGEVVVTTTAAFAPRLVPPVATLSERFPDLCVVVRAGDRVVDLGDGGADVAVRLGRPRTQGVVARKVGEIELGLYASDGYVERHGAPAPDALRGHRMLGYTGELRRLPEARWMRACGGRIVFRSDSIATLVEAARAGLGIAVLPHGAHGPGLRRLGPVEGLTTRSIYVACHESSRGLPRVRVVLDELAIALGERRRPAPS